MNYSPIVIMLGAVGLAIVLGLACELVNRRRRREQHKMKLHLTEIERRQNQ